MLTVMALEAQEKVQNRGTMYSIDLGVGCLVTLCGSKHQPDLIIRGPAEGLGWVSESGLFFLHFPLTFARRLASI